jgi:hypothetical protein
MYVGFDASSVSRKLESIMLMFENAAAIFGILGFVCVFQIFYIQQIFAHERTNSAQ